MTTLTSKGQVTIPKAIRDRLHLKTGDRLEFAVDPQGRVYLTPATSDIRDLRGLLRRPAARPVSVAEMDEGIARHLRRKHRRRRTAR